MAMVKCLNCGETATTNAVLLELRQASAKTSDRCSCPSELWRTSVGLQCVQDERFDERVESFEIQFSCSSHRRYLIDPVFSGNSFRGLDAYFYCDGYVINANRYL